MESACWKFDSEGALLNVKKLDERPWHLGLLASNEIIMGLGRPNCGASVLSEDNELTQLEITLDSPVTCGTERDEDTILGHANGGITCILNKSEVYFSENDDSSATSVLDSSKESVLQIQESGKVTFFLEKGEVWNQNTNQNIERGVIGFEYTDSSTIWLSYYDEGSRIHVIGGDDGTPICQFSIPSRVRSMCSDGRFVIIGLEDGNVYVIESEQFSRRMNSQQEKTSEVEDTSYRKEMLEKLRNLNKE